MDYSKYKNILFIVMAWLWVPVLLEEDDYSGNFIWILKCCPENNIMSRTACISSGVKKLKVPIYDKHTMSEDYSFKVNYAHYEVQCVAYDKEHFILQPQFWPLESFFLRNDGHLWLPKINASFSIRHFCLEYLENVGVIAAICIPEMEAMPKTYHKTTGLDRLGMGISSLCLLVTFIVYALLPERNLYEMCMMSYVFALFGWFFLLVSCYIYALLFGVITVLSCRIIAMVIYFCFVGSFFWTNVISFDIWVTFSGRKGKSVNEKKLFLKYSVYAWGMPTLFVILVQIIAAYTPAYEWYAPFGVSCWFQDGITQLVYMYGPVGIILLINGCLFVSTAYKIIKTRKETAILREGGNTMHSPGNNSRGSFKIYLKLMLVMGINWTTQFIQCALENYNLNVTFVKLLAECGNAALGVFIFFMFVFTRNTWNLLKKRYYMVTGKASSNQKTTATPPKEVRSTNC